MPTAAPAGEWRACQHLLVFVPKHTHARCTDKGDYINQAHVTKHIKFEFKQKGYYVHMNINFILFQETKVQGVSYFIRILYSCLLCKDY